MIWGFPHQGTIQGKYNVHRLNNVGFERFGVEEVRSGEICTCGHPTSIHLPWCTLDRTCGCTKSQPIIWVSDCRPFFQITHGPMEAHALGRGMKLSSELDVEIRGELECRSFCSQKNQVGAVRVFSGRKSIAPRKQEGEKHLILCNNCVEDFCLEKGMGRSLF